jgi:hypothetical protein
MRWEASHRIVDQVVMRVELQQTMSCDYLVDDTRVKNALATAGLSNEKRMHRGGRGGMF